MFAISPVVLAVAEFLGAVNFGAGMRLQLKIYKVSLMSA
jgi:hypothetical protein